MKISIKDENGHIVELDVPQYLKGNCLIYKIVDNSIHHTLCLDANEPDFFHDVTNDTLIPYLSTDGLEEATKDEWNEACRKMQDYIESLKD